MVAYCGSLQLKSIYPSIDWPIISRRSKYLSFFLSSVQEFQTTFPPRIKFDPSYLSKCIAVSRGEAGQQKALLVLDAAAGWKVQEEIPLDVGPRHYDVKYPLVVDPGESEQSTAAAATTLSLPEGLRRGDRVRLTLAPEHIKSQTKSLKSLTAQGIAVELVTPVNQPSAAPRISTAEELGPLELFSTYAALRGLSRGRVQRGIDLISQITTSQQQQKNHHPFSVSLSFSAVEVEGYFSFVQPVRYDLQKRGLVVVTGKVVVENNNNNTVATTNVGAESNGAGKTALVMAPLWALTGDVDSRSEIGGGAGRGGGLTNADVVNEDCKSARVKVEGEVDGVPVSFFSFFFPFLF